MPWVRMHAIKDYLDMLLIMDNYPSLKLNFNLVPVLVDSIYDYGYNGAHDIYSKLTIAEKLSDEEKEFVLNHFLMQITKIWCCTMKNTKNSMKKGIQEKIFQ